MHRERKGLIAFVLCVAALAVSQRSVADIRSIPLLPREDPRLLELTDGRFAVLSAETAYAHATGPVPVARHHTIQIAELSGKLHPPVPVPMRGYPEAVVPFHQGIVFWERNRGRSEVRYFDLKEGLRDSALYTASDIDYLYLSASPRGDALYVTESLRGGGSRLTRLDTNGRSLWSRVFAHISSNVVALPDGAVFAAASPTPTDFYSGALTRLDNDGEQQWQVPVLIGGGVPQVLRHSGNVIGVVARNAQGELELANHAEDSGREISRAIIPSDSHLTGTPDGVLFYRDFLYQPYLGMIGSDGSMRWWRRFRANETVGDPGPIVLSRKGVRNAATQRELEDAFQSGLAVECKVVQPVKGGYEVRIARERAFCPLSQIDIARTTDPAVHVGQVYAFKVIEYKNGGKDLVVSRRKLLEAQQQASAAEVRRSIVPGAVLLSFGLLLHLAVLLGLVRFGGRPAAGVTAVFATVFSVVGFEILSLGLHAKTYSWSRRFDRDNRFLSGFYSRFKLETGLLVGLALALVGVAILATVVVEWVRSDLLPLPRPEWASFGATLTILGLLMQGLTHVEVADALRMTPKQIENRLRSLRQRLQRDADRRTAYPFSPVRRTTR